MNKPFSIKSFKAPVMSKFGKILLLFVTSASLASAQTLLTGGDSTDGLALNSANVVDAIYAPWSTAPSYLSSYNGTVPVTFQGVAFSQTNPNITGSQSYLYHSFVSDGFGGPDTAVNSGFTNPGSPSAQDVNLLNLVNAGLVFNGVSASINLTVSNLTPNTSYRIDSIISLDGWPDGRTDTMTYNGAASDTITFTSGTNHNIYDVGHNVLANSLGQIQLTYSGSEGGYYSGLVVSNVGDVPEPSTWAMMLAGIAFLGFCMCRKRV
jgi:hypothetical protein